MVLCILCWGRLQCCEADGRDGRGAVRLLLHSCLGSKNELDHEEIRVCLFSTSAKIWGIVVRVEGGGHGSSPGTEER